MQVQDTANKESKVTGLTLVGLMAALLCIAGPLALPLPFSPVPISLSTFVVYLASFLLGQKKSALTCLIYLLLGLVGLPVFSGFSGGPAKLFGPTGGYLFGFLLLALIAGWFVDRKQSSLPLTIVGMILGTLACYLLGTAWLSYSAGMTFPAALAAGVLPFIPGDLAKILVVCLIGPQIRRRLPAF